MDNFGNMGVNMGVTVRIISKGREETEEKAAAKEIKPVVTEKTGEKAASATEKEKDAFLSYEKGYRTKKAYTRFGYGAVIVTGAVISAVMLLSLWAVKGFGDSEAALIADRIICSIG
ncbi:MAG: hypothetical protein ACI4KO_06575 [Ruminiclostridium sp.]